MYLDQRTKKFLKVAALVAFVFVLSGCTSNLDKDLYYERINVIETE